MEFLLLCRANSTLSIGLSQLQYYSYLLALQDSKKKWVEEVEYRFPSWAALDPIQYCPVTVRQ